MPPKIDAALKRRSNIKGSLTKISNYAQTCTSFEASKLDIEQLKVRLRRVEGLLLEFHEVENTINELDPEEESHQDDFEEKYYTTVAVLNKLIRKANLISGNMSFDLNDTQGEHSRSANIEVKLPKINIAPFYGSYTEWQSFYDLFSSTIHENPNLNPAQKFQYLKGFLRDEAANLLKHLPISDANYLEALNKLKNRYDRKRYTVQTFIKSFIDLPSINSTSQHIRKLMDTADEVIRGLKAIGPEAESRDPWLVFILTQKLDEDMRDKWATETSNIEFPTCQLLIDFLMKRADALDSVKGYHRKPIAQSKTLPKTFTSTVASCAVCQNDNHPLYKCPKFKEWTVEERRIFMKTDNRCFNCLSKTHRILHCRSKGRCHKCKGNHNSLLHRDYDANTSTSETQNSEIINQQEPSKVLLSSNTSSSLDSQPQNSTCLQSSHHAILPTATVRVLDKGGQHQVCRVLLDSGSQSSFITEAFVQKLGLDRRHGRICIQGLANQKLTTTRGIVDIIVSPHFKSEFKSEISAYVVPFITTVKPISEVDLSKFPCISNSLLADKALKSVSKIDLLIGADKFFDILKSEQIKDSSNRIYAHSTHFGWILTGSTIPIHETSKCNTVVDNSNLEKSLRKFWECEEVFQNTPPLLPDDQICENLFRSTTKKLPDNHFMVKLPFKPEQHQLKESLNIAIKRLCTVERLLGKNPNLHNQYHDFMQEYSKLGHMTEVKPPENPSEFVYLPHQAVIKETSTTTKLRVVFDASAKTTSGYSLNDNLLTGPTLQNFISDILVRFRTHKIVFTADAEKMFRQIWIDPDHRQYQRIVWRTTPADKIRHFELNTLTYGMSAAPYLATRVVKQISKDHDRQYPRASEAISEDIYVDDLITGARDVPAAVTLAQQISELMSQSGFNLRKWSSNSPEFMAKLNAVPSCPSLPKPMPEDTHELKVLGLQWQPSTDTFTYHVNLEQTVPTNKRAILSEASRIFDPLGLLAPFVVKIKSFFQMLWLLDLGWDDELPMEIRANWIKIRNEITEISTLKIPRWLYMNDVEYQLHGFCDSSETAFAAAVYLRTVYIGQMVTTLIAAKTKVAPIKNTSLPRLELNGALLLTRLIKHLQSIFNIPTSQIFCWTDSTIVLDWLSEPPRKWKTYVANRTSAILEVLQRDRWGHIKSKLNPADCATRGSSPTDLKNHLLWWTGPEFLKAEPENWPVYQKPESTSSLERRTKIQVMTTICLATNTAKPILEELITKYSSYDKIISILAIVRKFIVKYLKLNTISTAKPSIGWREAEADIIKFTQQQYFKDEIQAIEKTNNVSPKSTIKSLNPFLDIKGLLRVGGRIERAVAPYDTIHPIILPSKSEITTKLIIKYHRSNLHCGAALLLSIIRRRFWIVHARNTIKATLRKCVHCVKQRPRTETQIMGNLPKERVELIRPFLKVGLDFAGPIKTYLKRGRGQRVTKSYICLFICLSTKAIHLELVGDLTTDSFMAALNRFFARRGISTDIFSDNGSNFRGASQKFKEFNLFIKNNIELISNSIFKRYQMTWHFIPPQAPHFGGIWEAGIKSVKTHLERVIGSNTLTQEELNTLLVQIEGLLNSRPLCTLSDDESDPLTPAHFLIGHPITTIPQPDISEVPYNRLSHWNAILRMTQLFWRRWHTEYLTTMQARSKWNLNKENLQVNDIVLVKEQNPLVNQWKIGKIVEVFPGSDGQVRVAEILTNQGTIRRPITKLCRLPVC